MKGLSGLRNTIINVSFKDLDELYACYMPFVNHGGLFIEARNQHKLGDEVFVVMELPDEPEKYPLSGKVVWISPAGVGSNRKQGFGIQLSQDYAQLVRKIETLLAGRLNSDQPTLTL